MIGPSYREARVAVPRALDAAVLAGSAPDHVVTRLAGATMGTGWRVRVAHPPGQAVAALQPAIEARLAGLVEEMSHWERDSAISRFNALPAGAWMALPPDFARVMDVAFAVADASAGAFDPALGRLVSLWGFGPEGPMPAPDATALAAARAASGVWRLRQDGTRLRQPGGLALDLSGIAKGYAVDAVAAVIRAAGFPHALVEIGGELVGFGVRPDAQPWWVDLEAPPGVVVAPLRVALCGLAVATSGNYVRGDHTIDPESGRPVRNGVLSASVIAGSAVVADAWASALTVLGPEGAAEVAARDGIAARLLWRAATGIREIVTPALRAMLAD